MPNVLSKVLQPDWSFPYNCYEVGHTWTISCTEAALDMGDIVLWNAIRLYAPLYLASQFLQGKYNAESFKETLVNILRSSTFLSFNAFGALAFFCAVRHSSGRFYWSLVGHLPMFLASILAIHIEKPSRRGALAVYCANIASETLFRMAVYRGLVKPLPNGETWLFTGTMAILMYLIKKNGYGHDPVSLALKFIIGRAEAKTRASKKAGQANGNGALNLEKIQNGNGSIHLTQTEVQDNWRTRISEFISKITADFPSHKSCPHQGIGCLPYIVEGFARPYLMGWLAQAALGCVSKPQRFITNPWMFFELLRADRTRNFGMFLGSFTAIFRAVNCALRRHSDGARDWHGLVAGLLAGPAMRYSPNSSIAMYLLWKCIESLYCIGSHKGYFPLRDQTISLVYALATAQLFYVAVLEPRSMRPSYMKFLDRMSEHRLHWINRFVLDVFGTDASIGYEGYFPDLHPDYLSRQFKESVMVWLLEQGN